MHIWVLDDSIPIHVELLICFLGFSAYQPVILDYLASKTICSDDLVVVSPDVGGVARARAFAKKLSDAPLAIVDKRRHGHNVAEVGSLQMRLYFTVISAQKKFIFRLSHFMCQ